MKKKLPILALSAMLLVGLASCGSKPNPSTSGSKPTTTPTTATPTTSAEEPVVVESVTITGYEELTVLSGDRVTLQAEVKGNKDKLKVTWTSSDENVATVKNGVVKFLKISENKTVTITATSNDDATKFDSVTFTVVRTLIDLANSRGNLDTSMFLSDGSISTEVEDIAMMYDGVYGTKWYVEANITMSDFDETDGYPKFGLMTGTSDHGYWNNADEKFKNAFFYVDAMKSNLAKGWTSFNFVTQNELLNDWNWGGQTGYFNVSNDDKVEQNKEFRMGLLRDGIDYYLFTMKGEDIHCYNHVQWTGVAADEPSYAWVGGWKTAVTVKDFKSLTGDDVDKMYGEVTELNLSLDSTTLFLNESYTLRVTTNTLNYDRNKLTFTSSDNTIVTVDSTGKVTATEKPGKAVITVKYGEIEKIFNVEVTDDAKFKVVLDGKMDDLIWSDTVKANKYTLTLRGANEHIDFYGSRNSKGVYLFADYWVNAQKSGNASNDWWMNDNFETRFVDRYGAINGVNLENGGQGWISGNKTSNYTGFYVSSPAEENGQYHIVFEVFSSYEDMNRGRTENLVTKETVIGVSIGSNPASDWKSVSWWGSSKFVDYIKITENGLTFDVEKTLICPTDDSHAYTGWYIENNATCTVDGNERRDCTLCGNYETKVIKSNGEHTVDNSQITVTEVATCLKKGKGTTKCTSCQQDIEVELPIDRFNHEGSYANNVWSCCNENLQNKTVFNYPANTNWITNNFILGVMNGNADWTITADIDMIRTNGENDPSRGWAGQVQVENDEGNFDNEDAHKWVWRQDWWGWGYYNPANGRNFPADQVNKEGNCGGWVNNFDNDFDDYKGIALNDCNLLQTISFSHETGKVTIVTVITPNDSKMQGKVATATYESLAFPTDKKMEVGFGMLFSMLGTHTINSVKITGNMIEGPHAKTGAIGLQ